MTLSSMRSLACRLVPLLSLCVLAAGCSSLGRGQAPRPLADERASFTTGAGTTEILDAATVVLVNRSFTLALVNERVGLLQTEFVPLRTLQVGAPDLHAGNTYRDDLAMRVTLSVERRAGEALVQVRGMFQRRGEGSEMDAVVTRYWTERIAADIAERLEAPFTPEVTEAMYVEALQGSREVARRLSATGDHVMRAVGIVAVVLFAATLITGVLSPGTAEASPGR